MIRYLKIENFKSLKAVDLTLTGLNALMGMNGMGKSSVMQALLVLRQSLFAVPTEYVRLPGAIPGILQLDGDLVSLGSANEVLCQNAEKSEIDMRVRFSSDSRGNEEIGASFPITGASSLPGVMPQGTFAMPADFRNQALLGRNFAYLSAEHIGPRRSYSASGWNQIGINQLGNEGEYAVPFLSSFGDRLPVPDAMCLKSGRTNYLLDQVSAWMGEISSHIRLNAVYNPSERSAKLNISYRGQEMSTEDISPVNTGFGIPYVLPLLTILLKSKPGDLILLENPESHLHPRGQAKVGELICRAVASGAQVLCETHSDHIINSFRVAVKQGIISPDQLMVDYFDQGDDLNTAVTEIHVDRNGNLSEYPAGLLDEWGELMSELI